MKPKREKRVHLVFHPDAFNFICWFNGASFVSRGGKPGIFSWPCKECGKKHKVKTVPFWGNKLPTLPCIKKGKKGACLSVR